LLFPPTLIAVVFAGFIGVDVIDVEIVVIL
jgi:hypothetical protein